MTEIHRRDGTMSGVLFVPNYAWRIGPIILGGRTEMIGPAATAAAAAKSGKRRREPAAERARNCPNVRSCNLHHASTSVGRRPPTRMDVSGETSSVAIM